MLYGQMKSLLHRSQSKEGSVPKGKSFDITFDREKETPGTVRFSEQGEKEKQKVGKLYIKKAADKALGNPDSVTVTVAAE